MKPLSRFWRRLLPPCFIAVVGSAALLAVIPNPAPIRLAFDYPTNAMSTNLWFVLHGASNVMAPLTNWPVDKTIPASNWYAGGVCTAPVAGTNYTLVFTNMTIPAQRFWYITASNLWGESDFSNVLFVEPPPVRTGVLKAERAW